MHRGAGGLDHRRAAEDVGPGAPALAAHPAQGGLQNAILGTLVLAAGVVLIAGTLGIGAGIYLAEFAPARLARTLRIFPEVLAGVPSIVIGYTGYLLLVMQFHWGFSILSAVIALSALVTPYIVRSTEVALSQVPTTLREASLALGLPVVVQMRRVLLPPALPAIVTGLIVAIAISTGETAPLLYTANFSNADPTLQVAGNHPIGYLTYVTYYYIQLPGEKNHALANAAGAVTLIFLLILTLVGRLLASSSARRTARMGL
ncbi:MAG: PstA family ABC transporter permease [Candidatus Dormibacteraceae bacterium]